MSLLEIIGEWISPGGAGGVRVRSEPRTLPATWVVLTRTAISVAGATLLFGFLGFPNGLGPTLACLAYVVIATVFRPEPDFSNVGWFAGLIDHPFRISDDVNRFLIFMLLFLWPGWIVGSGFRLLFRFLAVTTGVTR